MSQHAVRVVRIPASEPHPNADKLVVYRVAGLQVVRTPLPEGTLGVLVEADYVAPKRLLFGPEAGDGEHRVKPTKIRGLYSEGVLLEAPVGVSEGDDVMGELGIRRYVPPVRLVQGDCDTGPSFGVPVYDLEPLHKFPDAIAPGEPVVVTEKIHGTNARFVWDGGRLHLGSRTQWRKSGEGVLSRVVETSPWILAWCASHPGAVLWGEVYGWVQDLRYGHGPGELSFLAFDVWDLETGFWPPLALAVNGLGPDQRVPRLYEGPFAPSLVRDMAEQPSSIDGGLREGVVVRPRWPRQHPELGNLVLKVVGNAYLSRSRV